VTVLESSITNSAQTRARLAGAWYLAVPPGGPGLTGDIWATIDIRQTLGGLFARWSIDQCMNSGCTTSDYSRSGVFPTPITMGKTYKLYIEYDNSPGNHRFIFRVDTEQIVYDAADLPIPSGNAVNPQKGIGTRVGIDDAASSGYISATFDNVYANDLLYDNFSLTAINPAKWTTYEFAREIKGGKFRSKVRSSEAYNSPVDGGIYFEIPTTISAFQAKVTPLIYQNPQGLSQTAGLWGVGYNDGTGTGTPGDRTGDVFGLVRIGGVGATPTAEWSVVKWTNPAGTTSEVLSSGTFSPTVLLGSINTLFVGWDGTNFTFKFNNNPVIIPHPPANPVVGPMNVPFAGIGCRISGQATGKKEGTIEALFDDVTVIVGEGYKLLTKSASPNGSTVSIPYNADNRVYFPDPNSVNSIRADVTVLENIITDKAHTRARLAGFWYNDGTSGAVQVETSREIALRKEPTGFRANWFIWKSTNPEGTIGEYITGGNFKAGITIGVTYPLSISYDSGINEFKFKIGSEEVIVNQDTTPALPTRIGPANTPWKELCTRVQINDPGASGYISATFDNVYRNGVLYDDFPSSTINKDNWTAYESVREISGGKFRSKIRSSSTTTSSPASRLEFLYPSEISAIQAKVTPLAYENAQGASLRTRIAGRFYNDGTPGGGNIGDIGAQVRIIGTGPNLGAEWAVWKFTNFEGSTFEGVQGGTFTTPISLGKTYTLYLGWDGIKFTFKIDNEVAYYEPETGVYPPNNPWRSIETQINYNPGDPTGKEATMEALFDDVMVSGPLPQFLQPAITLEML
jgi:hypothetical protein